MLESRSRTILLVGCGKMGSAMLEGWLEDAGGARPVDILEPAVLPAAIRDRPGIRHFPSADALKAAGASYEAVVLAIKPQVMDAVCSSLKGVPGPETLILSIAAGRTMGGFEAHFGVKQPIIRAMPNTPAAIGQGAIAAVSNAAAANKKALAAELLEPCGELHWLGDERLMDAVTALSGSGPAYVFYLIEVLAEAGAALGLPADLAGKLARKTVTGSAALAEHSPGTPASTLRENVTSPGGTTEAALKILMSGGMLELFTKALKAAENRGKELS